MKNIFVERIKQQLKFVWDCFYFKERNSWLYNNHATLHFVQNYVIFFSRKVTKINILFWNYVLKVIAEFLKNIAESTN